MPPHSSHYRTRTLAVALFIVTAMQLTACLPRPIVPPDDWTPRDPASVATPTPRPTRTPDPSAASFDCHLLDTTAYQKIEEQPLVGDDAVVAWVTDNYSIDPSSLDYQFSLSETLENKRIQPRDQYYDVKWRAEGAEFSMHLYNGSPFIFQIKWPSENTTLADALSCLGPPDGYYGWYNDWRLGSYIYVRLFYARQGIVIESTIPAASGMSELKRVPLFGDGVAPSDATIEVRFSKANDRIAPFLKSMRYEGEETNGEDWSGMREAQAGLQPWSDDLGELYLYNRYR